MGSDEAMDTSYSTNSSDCHSSPSPSPDVFRQVQTSPAAAKTVAKVVSSSALGGPKNPMLTTASNSSSSASNSKLPKFNINGPVTTKSFHEVGLPPVLRPKQPKQQASLLLANGSRGNIINHHLRTKFHDYENYFY